jgi:RNA polymerase sigma-70 factor (ECF subfamily)
MTADPFDTRASLLLLLRGVENDSAWRTFVERYTPLIHAWCRKEGLEPATTDDITSRVLTVLVTQMRSFEYDPAKSFRGWLKTVVKNMIRTFWREKQQRPGNYATGSDDVADMLSEVPDQFADWGDELEEKLAADLENLQVVLNRAQARVKPRTWDVFWRVEVQGFRPTDVAAEFGIKIAFVSTYRRRVWDILREEGEKLLNSPSR